MDRFFLRFTKNILLCAQSILLPYNNVVSTEEWYWIFLQWLPFQETSAELRVSSYGLEESKENMSWCDMRTKLVIKIPFLLSPDVRNFQFSETLFLETFYSTPNWQLQLVDKLLVWGFSSRQGEGPLWCHQSMAHAIWESDTCPFLILISFKTFSKQLLNWKSF